MHELNSNASEHARLRAALMRTHPFRSANLRVLSESASVIVATAVFAALPGGFTLTLLVIVAALRGRAVRRAWAHYRAVARLWERGEILMKVEPEVAQGAGPLVATPVHLQGPYGRLMPVLAQAVAGRVTKAGTYLVAAGGRAQGPGPVTPVAAD